MILVSLNSEFKADIPENLYESVLYDSDSSGVYDIAITLLTQIRNKYSVDLSIPDMLHIAEQSRISALHKCTDFHCRFFSVCYHYQP